MRTPLDEFAKLLENPSHDLSVDVYNGNKKIKEPSVKKHNNGRMTLAKLAVTVSDLVKEVREGFKQVNNRIDNLENDVNSLKQDVKNINARLDYNGLKKLPESSK